MAAVVAQNNESWQPLCRQFLDLVADPGGMPAWPVVWRLLVADPWVQAELRKHARFVLRGRLRRQRLPDLEHDALLQLAKALSRHTDLNVEKQLAPEAFPAWMGTILRNCCQEVLRAQASGVAVRLLSEHTRPPAVESANPQADVALALDELPELERTVMKLALEEFSLTEIAMLLDKRYDRVWRAWHRGRSELRARFFG